MLSDHAHVLKPMFHNSSVHLTLSTCATGCVRYDIEHSLDSAVTIIILDYHIWWFDTRICFITIASNNSKDSKNTYTQKCVEGGLELFEVVKRNDSGQVQDAKFMFGN